MDTNKKTLSCKIMMYPDPSTWGVSPSTRSGHVQ